MSTTIAEAKQFLVSRIAAEAERDGAPLDEVEMEMLCFGEGEASAKVMEEARRFERDYNDEAYENRIARLAKTAYDRDVAEGRKAAWDESLDELAAEDLYLMVMLEKAGLMKTTAHLALPDWRILTGFLPPLICVAMAIVFAVTPLGARIIPNLPFRLGVVIVLVLAPVVLGRPNGRQDD